MTAPTFRLATVDDVPAVVALVTSAYRGETSRAGWTTEADLLDGERLDPQVLRADLERPDSKVLLAERAGQLVGCAHVAVEDGAGYFGMFAVRPDLQGAGLGKQVMGEAERLVREEWALPVLRMTVLSARSDLIAFYERRGFRRTGATKPFPYGDERFGRPRRDDLEFAVLEKEL